MSATVLAPSCDLKSTRRVSGNVQFGGKRSSLSLNAVLSARDLGTLMTQFGVAGKNNCHRAGVGQRTRRNTNSNFQVESPTQTPRSPRYVAMQTSAHPQKLATPNTGIWNNFGAGTDAGFELVLMSAKAQGKTALCIWFHYLTGRGADWEIGLKSQIANQLPWMEWYFPDAPKKPVTSFNGRIERCWFDQLQEQVTETMATPGLKVSVSRVHALLRQAEAHGFPANRVFLGGMSQGGVLAISAGLGYERPLAGIIAISAWVPPNLSANMRQPSTPLMIGNGDQDEVVPMSIVRKSIKKLEQAGCNRICRKIYPGLDHTWKIHECDDVKRFILSVIPNTRENVKGLPSCRSFQY